MHVCVRAGQGSGGRCARRGGGSETRDRLLAGGRGSAILLVTRSSEVVGSTSDEATGVLTWLLRTCPLAHSDCSKVGDEKYVTGKYPAGEE